MQDKISERRLQRIVEIINNYDCSKPLHLFLKEYFRSHPEMGSTDRRIASSAIYNYFRLGKALPDKSIEEKVSISGFLCQSYNSPFLQYLLRNYSFFPQDEITFPIERKFELIQLKYPEFKVENIFPFKNHISSDLDFEKFVKNIFIQPKVWIRVREKYYSNVEKELKEKNVSFEKVTNVTNALGFDNNVKLTELNSFRNGYFEIQDLSSQKTGNYLSAAAGEEWWDCCAGAGGKSLMLKDKFPDVKLLATDVRPSILQNLELRFKKAGIVNYNTKLIDLEKEDLPANYLFDGIIADVPCSGSGTWGRTPESISCFNEDKIFEYQEKQKTISLKAASHLKPGCKLTYITCSVFKEENEEIVNHIINNSNLQLQEMKLIQGSEMRADCLFVAVLESS